MTTLVRTRRLAASLCAATLATFAASAITAGPASAAPKPDPNRTITVGNSSLIVTNEGDCSKMTVTTVGGAGTVDYSIDADCRVVVGSAAAATALAPSVAVSSPAGATAMSATSQAAVMSASSCSSLGNIVKGSQALQDVVNIEIATFRFARDRWWDTCSGTTKFNASAWVTSATQMSWNHKTSDGVLGAYTTSWSSQATAYAWSTFHSDFLWCNLQAGQNFQLTTMLTSNADGTYRGTYTQSKVCSGTHMATATKANTTGSAW